MNQDILAKELLLRSFMHSCLRIETALNGGLVVRNSREPNDPPINYGVIVGLCGQGGRHPYFTLPVSALQVALQDIHNLDTSDVEAAVEQLSVICQALRQRAHFNSNTGCVNDRLPGIVPLLPPEEIWYNQGEMPLDIWRLLSFEFDSVASSISADTSTEHVAFASFSQEALAFRHMMRQLGQRRVIFDVSPRNIPSPWQGLLPSSRTIDVPLSRLFFEAGCLLTPLAPNDQTKWFTAIRYMHWISDQSSEFRVKDEFDDDSIDSRYRGLFAEEMAVGMMAVVLGECFGAAPINNTSEVLPKSQRPAGQPIADFIAYASEPGTSRQTTVIAESKGSLGGTVSAARSQRAKIQVGATNARIGSANTSLPLAFSSSIFFEGQLSNSTRCDVDDPPNEWDDESIFVDLGHSFRTAYAQAFRFMGMSGVAKQILQGKPASGLSAFDSNPEDQRSDLDELRHRRAAVAREMFQSHLVADMGHCAISVNDKVMGMLREGIREGSDMEFFAGYLNDHSKRRRKMGGNASFETSLGIGCVYYSELDDERPLERSR